MDESIPANTARVSPKGLSPGLDATAERERLTASAPAKGVGGKTPRNKFLPISESSSSDSDPESSGEGGSSASGDGSQDEEDCEVEQDTRKSKKPRKEIPILGRFLQHLDIDAQIAVCRTYANHLAAVHRGVNKK